jgi:hypothetical protein
VYRPARRPTPTSRLGRWRVVVNGVMVAGLVTSACGGDEPAQEVTTGEPPGPANEIVLEVRTVGTPRIALINDTEDAAPGSAEASGCVEASGPVGFDCRKGGVDFALRGFVSPHGVHFAGDPEDINTHYDDRVLRPLADMVMAKLP